MNAAHVLAPLTPATVLRLDLIRLDGATQSRDSLRDDVIDEYADAYRAGIDLPAVVVFYDGETYWLADGFHRVHAARKAGAEGISTDVRQGTQRDAILHSVGANETHGLRRSREDRRRAVLLLLNDAEWVKASDRWIAERCRVTRPMVARLRGEVERVATSESGTGQYPHTRAGRDGKQYPAPPPKAEKAAEPREPTRAATPVRTVTNRDSDYSDEPQVHPEEAEYASPGAGSPRARAIAERVRTVTLNLAREWPAGDSYAPLIATLAELKQAFELREERRG